MSLVQSDPLWLVLLPHKVQHPSSLVYVLTLLYCTQLHIAPQAIILDTKAGNHQKIMHSSLYMYTFPPRFLAHD